MRKNAIITGGSRGIGAALAKRLAEEEDITVNVVARSEKELDILSKMYPGKIISIVADLSEEQGINTVIQSLSKVKIHYLVNNAAILGVEPLNAFNFEKLQKMFAVNAFAPRLLIKGLDDAGVFTESSRIMNISTRAVDVLTHGLGIYSATKAALQIFTKQEKIESPHLLSASFIPGEVDTYMQQQLCQFPPTATAFQEAKKTGKLISAELCAEWLAWELLKATRQQFLAGGTIYDSSHHVFWLKDRKLPMPQEGMTGLPSVSE